MARLQRPISPGVDLEFTGRPDMLGRMSRFEVLIEPSGRAFTTDAETPLVTAAQRCGIRLVSSCRNGTCRTCICRLVAGHIRYRIEWPGLSAEEKAAGWILPCVALARSDLLIDAPSATNWET